MGKKQVLLWKSNKCIKWVTRYTWVSLNIPGWPPKYSLTEAWERLNSNHTVCWCAFIRSRCFLYELSNMRPDYSVEACSLAFSLICSHSMLADYEYSLWKLACHRLKIRSSSYRINTSVSDRHQWTSLAKIVSLCSKTTNDLPVLISDLGPPPTPNPQPQPQTLIFQRIFSKLRGCHVRL